MTKFSPSERVSFRPGAYGGEYGETIFRVAGQTGEGVALYTERGCVGVFPATLLVAIDR